MPSIARYLHDIASWTRGSGLELVLLVTGAILLTRFATWLGGRITDRIDANAKETDALVRSEASKHRHALAEVITWAAVLIWVLVRPSTPTVAVAPPATAQPASTPTPVHTTSTPRTRTAPRPTRLAPRPSPVPSTRTPRPSGAPKASPSPSETPTPSATSPTSH